MSKALMCVGCGRVWPQPADHTALMPEAIPGAEDWARRQGVTARYYHSLLDEPSKAADAFDADFAAFRSGFAALSGRLLDLGGGNGLVRQYLPASVEYVSVDPDLTWLDHEWDRLEKRFACLRQPLQFVQGVAECLPFADQTFDCGIALFSLNHCSAPPMAIQEMARILRPGGVWLVVLEDAEPGWRDVFGGEYQDWRGWTPLRVAVEKAKGAWCGWPIEADHVRISERAMASWVDGIFVQNGRRWHGSYLALELVRR
jgi:ubiquinone/menaquinone biosynthesis C-methylase UbiE